MTLEILEDIQQRLKDGESLSDVSMHWGYTKGIVTAMLRISEVKDIQHDQEIQQLTDNFTSGSQLQKLLHDNDLLSQQLSLAQTRLEEKDIELLETFERVKQLKQQVQVQEAAESKGIFTRLFEGQ